MSYSPLTIKRKQILGDIYERCEKIDSIPVYLKDKTDEPLGHVDECSENFADSFLFHLPEVICKKLSSGQFEYIFEYEYAKKTKSTGKKRRIILSSMLLVPVAKPATKKSVPDKSVKSK